MNIKTIAPMAAAYSSYRYLWPPRPESKAPPDKLPHYDDGRYLAQPKLNGSNLLLFMNDQGEKHIMTRHGADQPKTGGISIDTGSLYRGTGWMCLNGEWMEKSKKDGSGRNFNGNFIIFDILAYDGYILLGSTVKDRVILLRDLYRTSSMEVKNNGTLAAPDDYLYTTGTANVYRVKTFDAKFSILYNKLAVIDMYEGLVLKERNGELRPMYTQRSNSNWAIKFRKETRNYHY